MEWHNPSKEIEFGSECCAADIEPQATYNKISVLARNPRLNLIALFQS